MTIQDFIAGEEKRFEESIGHEDFCFRERRKESFRSDKCTCSINDSKSFLSESHAKNLERLIGEVEGMKKEDRVYHYLAKNKRKSAVEMLKNDGWNLCLTAVKELLSKELSEIRK